MHAIAGYLGIELTRLQLDKMLQTMEYRCPGAFEISRLPEGGLIRSTSFHRGCESFRQGKHQLAIAFSGRIDNREVLGAALRELGHQFRSGEDPELVLHAYSQWGKDCLSKFCGPFAFAVWEEPEKRLFLARDPMGMKSLFYRISSGSILFASEMKTILAAGVPAQLDEEGAAQLLLLGPGRIPGSGVLRDIREMKPGWYGYFQDQKLILTQYWQLRDREYRESLEETAEQVRYLIQRNVRRQMGENTGVLLSGGLDSSLITAICAAEHEKTGTPLHTFSVDYRDNDRYFSPGKFQPDSDEKYIGEMAAFAGSDHHRTVLSPEDLVRQLEQATIARDLPGMGDVDFSLMAFCREVRKTVPSVLSGECADEIFGGYPWYRDPEIRDSAGFPWAQNLRQRSGLLAHKRKDARTYVLDLWEDTCRSADVLPGADGQERRIREMVNLNLRWFMQNLLERNERMRGDLEIRVPFCDPEIAEYLYSVPWDRKEYGGREKGLLRYAFRGLLPETVRMRRKSPYPKTYDPQYESLVTARLRNLLGEDRPLWYLADRQAVSEILKQPDTTPWYGQLMRRPQLIAYLLQMDFWLSRYEVEMCF